MPLVRVPAAGQVGVNADLSSHELPPNAWTDALNVRFLDGMAWQFYGHGEVYAGAPVVPLHILPVNVAGARYWLYASAGKIYAVTGNGASVVHTDLTRSSGGDYAGAANKWTSTLLSGIPVLNPGNTVDVPQRWNLSLASKFAPLDNWPANTYCKSLRSFKNFLIALGVTKSGTSYPYMVKWSHPADPGSVPISWDQTDPTKDAGETDLAEGFDPIVDGLQLRDSFIIYKEGSTWAMTYTGGAYVFSFKKVLGTSGLLTRNSVVEVDGLHFCLTGSDVIIHDGQQATSVLDKQTRRKLFQSIDAQNYDKCFVFKNPFLNEVFVCYPEIGSTIPNKAMAWNYKDKTVSFREIPNLNHAACGPVEVGLAQPWDGDSSPWNSDITLWNSPEFTPDLVRVMMASNDQKLFLLDSSTTFNGTIPTAYVERRGLSFGAPENIKLVRGVRPRIKGNDGETVMVKVGSANDPYDDPTFSPAIPFVIGSTVACDCFVSGRYLALRVESGTAYQWRLDSYDVDVETTGMW